MTRAPAAPRHMQTVLVLVFLLRLSHAASTGGGQTVGGGAAGGGGATGGAGTTAAVPSCGPVPDSVSECLGSPQLITPEVASECPVTKTPTQCARYSCVARAAGWINGTGWLEQERVERYLMQWASTRAQWARAVDHVRSVCLSGPLPPQGAVLNCPAYDIFHCTLATLYKKAEASAWRSGPACEAARAFVRACPLCPSECFAVAIPIGSCNLCLSS